MTDPPANESLARALAAIPSGCAILTAAADGESTGMLASWIQQAAFDPPMVTVAVKQGRPVTTLIAKSKRFTLNLLGEDPSALFKHFGSGFALGEPAFSGLATTTTDDGIDLADAFAVLRCRVATESEAADHTVYVAEVVSAQPQSAGKPYVHLRKSGLSY